ncbi:MAG: ROK family transcriptional regulator [bacterium]|nr:ROK family transcriptional regulator [bacterium]
MIRSDMRSLLKNKTAARILKVLHLNTRLSRVAIARLIDASPSTVSAAVEKLEAQGIVYPVASDDGSQNVGRRPVLMAIDPDAFYLIGIDISLEGVILVLTNSTGQVIARTNASMNLEIPPGDILQAVVRLTDRLVEQNQVNRDKLLGIGISFLGLIDKARRVAVYSSTLPGWKGIAIAETFERAFNLPTFLENNANAMTLGEARFGAAKAGHHIFGVHISRGLGGGIIVNRELYTGHFATAGEFGHMIINANGAICTCGMRGCLNTIASESAIVGHGVRMMASDSARLLKQRMAGPYRALSAGDVVAVARQGCGTCAELLNDAADAITIGLVNVTNLLSPEMIVFNPSELTLYEPFMTRIRTQLNEKIYSQKVSCPDIRIGTLGETALAVGAATLVIDNMLTRA